MSSGSGKYKSYNIAVKKGLVPSGGSAVFRNKKTKQKGRMAALAAKNKKQNNLPF